MKICFVIGSMSFSGAEKVLSALVNNMEKQGHDIHIILLQEKPGVRKTDKNITFYGAYSEGNMLSRLKNRFLLIRKSINRISPDLVVSFGYVCNINSVASLLFTGFPLILCERNDPNYDPASNWGKKKRKLLYSLANGFVFQTEDIKNYFSKSIQKRSVVIPNPVIDDVKEMKTYERKDIRKKIINMARLDDYQKNQTMLIKSFSKIANKIIDYDLYIYGDGPDKEKYQLLINKLNMDNRIFLAGKSENVIETLSNAEIFVLTSNFEGMPNALIEAMSIGLPCISTDCGGGGAKALIKNLENGVLIPKGDSGALEKALVLLANNTDLRNRLAKEAYRINEQLNMFVITDMWTSYFYSIKG